MDSRREIIAKADRQQRELNVRIAVQAARITQFIAFLSDTDQLDAFNEWEAKHGGRTT